MAEKKNEIPPYGSSALPEGERKYNVIRWGWNGLNRTDKIDTGQLTEMSGMICDPPYMEPVKAAKTAIDFSDGIPIKRSGVILTPVDEAVRAGGTPISISGDLLNDNVISVVWLNQDHNRIWLSRYFYNGKTTSAYPCGWYCLGDFELGVGGLADLAIPRTILTFNAVDTSSGNIVQYTYDQKQLVYPDCYSVPMNTGGSAASFNTQTNPIPNLKFATVYNSRVFGVTKDNLVTASAYNSYVDYSLDTADDVSSAHAWASMAGSNTDADGDFTAMTTYDNHVVLWRRDFMQLVYNNKNPFRIVDVGKFGCDNNRAWVILNGVLYFASHEKVYAYTGGTPKVISGKLEAGNFSGAVLGGFKNRLWIAKDGAVYTYDTTKGVWSDVGAYNLFGDWSARVVQFATLDYGLAALVKKTVNGNDVYSLSLVDWDTSLMDLTDDAQLDWNPEYPRDWYFVTDIMALGRLDVRRVKKCSVFVEGDAGAEVTVYLMKDGIPPLFANDKFLVGTLKLDYSGFGLLRVLTRQFSSTLHQLVFMGKGRMVIHAAELKVSWGGDLYKGVNQVADN